MFNDIVVERMYEVLSRTNTKAPHAVDASVDKVVATEVDLRLSQTILKYKH